jgi:hypothetical protein
MAAPSLGQDASLSFVVRGGGHKEDCRFGISKNAEKRDFTVGTAFHDLSLSKVSRDWNDFNGLPFTVYHLRLQPFLLLLRLLCGV